MVTTFGCSNIRSNTSKVKNILLPVLLCLFFLSVEAQDISTTIRFGVAKQFKLSKKARIELDQQFQSSPRVRDKKMKKEDDLFNEIELLPFRSSNETTTTNTNGNGNGGIFKDLDDDAKRVDADFRTATTVDFDYKLSKWLRFGQSYSLAWDTEEIRHSMGTDFTIQPKLPVKKLSFSNKLGAQFATREKKGETIIKHSIASQIGLDWQFKKDHRLYSRATVNGGFDEKIWEWDRLRWDSGLRYTFNKVHTFDFSYRFQQRLTGKKRTAEGVVFRYSIDF